MAERRIIVVSECAPRMKKHSSEATREFLREYFSYQNRVEETEVVVAMKVLIEAHELDILHDCFYSEGWCRLLERRTFFATGVAQERRRAALQTPMTPAVLSASFDREVDTPSFGPEGKAGV